MLGTVMSFEEHPDCAKRKRPALSRPTEQSPRGSNGANGPSVPHGEPASFGGAERLFSAASRAHHDLKGAMADNPLDHELLAMANTD